MAEWSTTLAAVILYNNYLYPKLAWSQGWHAKHPHRMVIHHACTSKSCTLKTMILTGPIYRYKIRITYIAIEYLTLDPLCNSSVPVNIVLNAWTVQI